MELKKGVFCPPEVLHNHGWRFLAERGDYQVWYQGNEELYYAWKSGFILGVYQIS